MLGEELFVISNRVGQLIMVQVNHAFFVSSVNSYAVARYNTAGNANNYGVGGNFLQHHAAAADFGIVAHLEGAQNLGAAGNNHIIANGGMALALFLTRTAQGYALIEGNIAAKLGCFADNQAHAVVDKETGAQFSTGMDINAG